ncbi:MAG: GspE/PulE family protein [Candidatus Xenobiia bacterium LiM19]
MSFWLEGLKDNLTAEQIFKAENEQKEGRDPVDYLISNKIIDGKTVLAMMSRHYRHPSIELDNYHPDEQAVQKITEEVARRFSVLPLFELEDRLYVAMANPEDIEAQDFIQKITGLTVEAVIASRQAITASLNRIYLTREKSAIAMGTYLEEKKDDSSGRELEILLEDEDAPAIKLVNYILTQAVNLGASDVHIEPFSEHALLRYRVDGILHEFPAPPPHLYRALVSRIKIISNLDVAERRLPQDGRSSFQVDERNYDLRISIIPNIHGEGVVIRVLDTQGKGKELSDLGYSQAMLLRYEQLIKTPYGIFLVTGPTGSGKSTTLYATLKRIFTPRKKIITIEDPVEYKLDGVTQIQVNPDISFTFAAGLRSILRHDPDVIMLGEIRDLESAEIAIRSSLTGHLVFSTLHTNDSVSAITRLVDMGVPTFLVFASLIGVIAQRLVRRLCPECKAEAVLDQAQLDSLGIASVPEKASICRPVGCQVCNHLGYHGRVAIYEMLEVTQNMRRLHEREVTPEILKDMSRETGFVSLRESAVEKLLAGVVSIEDVLAFTTGL